MNWENHSYHPWNFLCPACSEEVDYNKQLSEKSATCLCGNQIDINYFIPDFLTPDRRKYFDKFLKSYLSIRHLEGRAELTVKEYNNLPYVEAGTPLAWQWYIRAKSYEALKKLLLRMIPEGAKILDLGAGNGWLCNRLNKLGYDSLAVDVNIDEFDGLRAIQTYGAHLPSIRCEFDNLPVENNTVDAVIFNASFHYVANAAATLSNIMRIIKPGGFLIIMDSPVYKARSSGDEMIATLHDDFEKKYGDRSDHLNQIGFLTHTEIDRLADQFSLKMKKYKIGYGIKWALRPWIAKIKGKREPAKFALYSFQKID